MKSLLVAALLVLAACEGGGAGAPAGERRDVRKYWPARGAREPLLRATGQEVVKGGEWVYDGDFTFYDEGGRKIAWGRYADGLEEGPWTKVEENDFFGTGSFRAGRREGRWTYYYPGGVQVNAEGAYVDGHRTGQWLQYYDDGTPAAELMYKDGEWHGECRFYERDGALDTLRTGRYAMGQRVQ